MSTVVGIALAVVFVAWFAVSIAAHVWSGLSARLWRLEQFALIPHWNFFAPHPGVHDMHLLYRDVGPDGRVVGGLGYVPVIEARRWYHAVWHPDKYRSKVVSDVTMSVQGIAADIREREGDMRAVVLSSGYVMAVHLVMQMPRAPEARARQFILARHSSFGDEPEHQVVFLSEFHPFAALPSST